MTKDTQISEKARCGQLVVACDEQAIETAWKKAQESIENSNYFSYTLEPTGEGKTRITLWPFVINNGSIDSGYLELELLDLPYEGSFVKDIYMPFKKKVLKKLCVLCLTRPDEEQPIRVSLMVDKRAGKNKKRILNAAYIFCASEFRKAYANADLSFMPARIMNEISTSLARNLF